MPNRMLSGELARSDSLSRVSMDAEVTFLHLVSVADDYGRFDGRPSVLLASLFPTRMETISAGALARWLRELEVEGLIRWYEVDGRRYLELPGWSKYQRVRESKSKYPAPLKRDDDNPPRAAASRREPPQKSASSVSDSDPGVEDDSEDDQNHEADAEAARPRVEEPSVTDLRPLGRMLIAAKASLPAERDEVEAWLEAHTHELVAAAELDAIAKTGDPPPRAAINAALRRVASARWRHYLRGPRDFRGAAERRRAAEKVEAWEREHRADYDAAEQREATR